MFEIKYLELIFLSIFYENVNNFINWPVVNDVGWENKWIEFFSFHKFKKIYFFSLLTKYLSFLTNPVPSQLQSGKRRKKKFVRYRLVLKKNEIKNSEILITGQIELIVKLYSTVIFNDKKKFSRKVVKGDYSIFKKKI